jgi:hypothetical protein
MATLQSVSRWVRANPNQLLGIGVAALVLGMSGWMGTRARSVAADLSSKRSAWNATASQLATVQQQFRAPSSTESASLIAESSRMGALGVRPGDKLSLVDMMGRLAEACALTAIRVNTVPASDSAFVVSRQLSGVPIKPADYALAVEFVGSFANAQKFVSSLPPSVSLWRLTATRRTGGALYQLVLSVYELDANSGP